MMAVNHETAWQWLNQLEQNIKEQLQHMTDLAAGESLGEAIQELSMYDNHPADVASEVFERSKDLAFRDRLSRQLADIDAARKRISEGVYGRCSDCGAKIDPERLAAKPTAELCLACQTGQEQRYPDRHPRPIEEDVAPFTGKQVADKEQSPGFDGEDTWQVLATYGSSNTPSDGELDPEHPHTYAEFGATGPVSLDVDQLPVAKDRDGIFYRDYDGPK
ncbi:MAG: TraR/DksA C4-type zinc finger protein [Heliobacteriaceae bacterium]|nr:TraR/DksA C4-type zinc finger protein [Heliobacteriaceae bacterium]MDD4587466.1 TraR/DksA C4-type zinc finger protein [Heliobacteriaceae bacterium]